MISAANNKSDLFSLILKSGADFRLKNKQNKTAYDIAKQRKSVDVLNMFVQLNIDIARASKPKG